MITDDESNIVFESNLLRSRNTIFSLQLESILRRNTIRFDYLKNTKDIWCRDYMPVQVSKNKFIQFKYSPSYLSAKKFRHLKTNPEKVCSAINISAIKTKIILDGGNVVRSKKKIILTDKIFIDNKWIPKRNLLNELYELFEAEDIIIIPHQPNDVFGHADGMVRFLDEDTILLNDFSAEKKYFRDNLLRTLKKHHLATILFTYSPSSEKNETNVPSAIGTYINYLHIGNFILMPTFNITSDDSAFKQLISILPNAKISTLNCVSIASEGGVLNCITWNIDI